MSESPQVLKEFLSSNGRKGGQSRSARKVRKARKNIVKAQKFRSRFKSEKTRRMAIRAAETRRRNSGQLEIDRENWLWDTFKS